MLRPDEPGTAHRAPSLPAPLPLLPEAARHSEHDQRDPGDPHDHGDGMPGHSVSLERLLWPPRAPGGAVGCNAYAARMTSWPVDVLVDKTRMGFVYLDDYRDYRLGETVSRSSFSSAPAVSPRECSPHDIAEGWAYFENIDAHWPI